MLPHKLYGNLSVLADPTHGNGNVVINGDLTVNGASTILNVEKTITADSIIGTNTPVSVAGRDSGLVAEKHPDDLVNPFSSGTVTSATASTVTISETAAEGYIIVITGGTGAGQNRKVTGAAGTTANITPDWSTIPDGTSTYTLYNETNVAFIYDTSADLFRFGTSANNSEKTSISVIEKPIAVERVIQTKGEQIIYVGKHGNDSYSGATISEAKLTFGAAVTAGNKIVCLDSGNYTENITTAGKAFFAPNATITGNTDLTNCTGVLGDLVSTSGNTLTVDNCDLEINSIDSTAIGIFADTTLSHIKFGQINSTATGVSTTINLNLEGNKIEATGSAIIADGGDVDIDAVELVGDTVFSADNGNVISATAALINAGTNLANTNLSGIVKVTAGDVIGETVTGSGTTYWVDAEKAHTHIASTANPHNVTLEQIGILTTKGDILTHNSLTHQRLAVGTNGQVLTANSAAPNGIEWSDSSGGAGLNSFTLVYIPVLAQSTNYVTKSQISWRDSLYGDFSNGAVIVNAVVDGAGPDLDIRVRQDATTIGSLSISTTGQYSIGITTPTADSIISLDVKKSSLGTDPVLTCATLKFGLAGATLDSSTQYDYKTVSGTYNATASDHYLLADTSGSPVNIVLPAAFKKIYVVIDKSGNALSNNITVSSSSNINGVGSYVISQNYGRAEFVSDTVTWYAG